MGSKGWEFSSADVGFFNKHQRDAIQEGVKYFQQLQKGWGFLTYQNPFFYF